MKWLLPVLLGLLMAAPSMGDEIETIRKVSAGSEGAAEAREARNSLVAGGAKNLIPILKGFKGSSVLASNWLRSAFEAIADAEIKAGRFLPKQLLLDFVADTSESPTARRLAYEWLLKRRPELEDELIPNMLTDPSPAFRRDAVARLLQQAENASGDDATKLYRQALQGAVHEDQVKKIAKALRDAGQEVDLPKHFGFLTEWQIIGPFDNKEEKGYSVAYPPEEELNLEAEYIGVLGKLVWQPIATDDDFGVVNIAEQLDNYKGSLMYATTTWNSPKAQEVEIRLGTPNAWKLWVNDKLVFEREEYHRSTKMDQYRVPVELRAGKNRILLKVCQNEQEQPWAQRYQYQLRISDSTGAGLLPADSSSDQNAGAN
jgi:hypothetical protein